MINHSNRHSINIFWWRRLALGFCSKMPNINKVLALKRADVFSILLESDDHSPQPASPSICHSYINLFTFPWVFGSALHKHKKMQQKAKVYDPVFSERVKYGQGFCQSVNNINRQDGRINIIQIIGRHFT